MDSIQSIFAALLGAVAGWSVAGTIVAMAERWEQSAENSHGWLVPIFAVYLLWSRRSDIKLMCWPGLALCGIGGLLFLSASSLPLGGAGELGLTLFSAGASYSAAQWYGARNLQASWVGLVALLLSVAAKWAAGFYFYEWFDQLAILPIVAAAAWAVGGARFLLWTLPSTLFLVFMIPLPFTLETMLRSPLRQVGTTLSTAIMQTIGLPAFAEGYVIVVGESRIGVAEACSGLRMLMVFAATAVAVVLTGRRPLWQNLIVLLSAVPIALLANVFRITVTGILYSFGMEKLADITYHDLAGWGMMPIGLGLLGILLWYLDRLVIFDAKRPMDVGIHIPGPSPR